MEPSPKIRAALNTIKSTLGIGNYWYWPKDLDLPAEIPIQPLVYPFRFDILIRKAFFEFYKENISLYRQKPEAFVKLAKGHDYFKWFNNIFIVRNEKGSIGNQEKVNSLFTQRVHEVAALYDSIQSEGFDLNCPIIPYVGENILPTNRGEISEATYFMGDGCHRLAYLMSEGYTTIPRQMIRVKCFKQWRPIDNTSLLKEHLEIDWSPFLASQSDGSKP
jgi:hypothetical protein